MSNISMMPLHTFELSIIITAEEYQNCRNILYAVAKEMNVQCFDENGWLNFRGFRSVGVSLSMCKNKERPGAVVRLQVNPSTLLGNTDPTELFLPTKKRLKNIVRSLRVLLRAISFPREVEDFSLHRLDICKDVRLEKQEHLVEYLRLFRRGANRSHWTEERFGDERDDHSVRRKRDDTKSQCMTRYSSYPSRIAQSTVPNHLSGMSPIISYGSRLHCCDQVFGSKCSG